MLMASYNFWLDCGRVSTIIWSMLALTIQYNALMTKDNRSDMADQYISGSTGIRYFSASSQVRGSGANNHKIPITFAEKAKLRKNDKA
jgi:hypothetical protein